MSAVPAHRLHASDIAGRVVGEHLAPVQEAGLGDVIRVVSPRLVCELEAGVDAELLVDVAEVAADGEGGDVDRSARSPDSNEDSNRRADSQPGKGSARRDHPSSVRRPRKARREASSPRRARLSATCMWFSTVSDMIAMGAGCPAPRRLTRRAHSAPGPTATEFTCSPERWSKSKASGGRTRSRRARPERRRRRAGRPLPARRWWRDRRMRRRGSRLALDLVIPWSVMSAGAPGPGARGRRAASRRPRPPPADRPAGRPG
jgi:hypothetical protein